jgi:hypothetical protein
LQGSDHIPADLIQAGDEVLRFEIHRIIVFIRINDELPEQKKEFVIAPIYNILGCAKTQAVSRWLPTAAARVRSRVW